jgi:hypothetical protein
MEEREISAITSGVKSWGGLGDVLPHDCRVANLPVAETKLEVSEADCIGIVGLLGITKRSAE